MSDKVVTKLGRDTRWNRILYGFLRDRDRHHAADLDTCGPSRDEANLPDGAFVLAPVHRSYIDTPISTWVQVRRECGTWARTRCGSTAGSARCSRRWVRFPSPRGSIDREALKRCIDVLQSGQPLVLFPEGERKDGPIVHPLMDGAAFLAAKADVPLVPVGIAGSDRAMPRKAKFVYPRKVHVIIGEPFRSRRTTTGRASREQLSAATERLHDEMQSLYDRALEHRKSAEERAERRGQVQRIVDPAQLTRRMHRQLGHADVDGVDAETASP